MVWKQRAFLISDSPVAVYVLQRSWDKSMWLMNYSDASKEIVMKRTRTYQRVAQFLHGNNLKTTYRANRQHLQNKGEQKIMVYCPRADNVTDFSKHEHWKSITRNSCETECVYTSTFSLWVRFAWIPRFGEYYVFRLTRIPPLRCPRGSIRR